MSRIVERRTRSHWPAYDYPVRLAELSTANQMGVIHSNNESNAAGTRRLGGCGSARPSRMSSAREVLYDLELGALSSSREFVEVAFRCGRRAMYRNRDGLALRSGDAVIVEANRGIDLGTAHLTGELARARVRALPLETITEFPDLVRLATDEEIEEFRRLDEENEASFGVAERMIAEEGLPMKLVNVEWQFDRNRVTFYFTADHRVDFRNLVRRLARECRTRVELRQIGARDEAAKLGGLGSCGRELCCTTWLRGFTPVSTHAARHQNLPMNPARLSGQCGRLKCCLNYELEQYMHALREYPPMDSVLRTPRGPGVVKKIDIFKGRVWIRHAEGSWEDLPVESARQWQTGKRPE